jgi:hypothetical protein
MGDGFSLEEMQQYDETRERIIKRSREVLKSRCRSMSSLSECIHLWEVDAGLCSVSKRYTLFIVGT